MKLQERSYNGKFTRPRPEIHIEEQTSLIIIATPWGVRSGARRAIQTITDFYLSSMDDTEVTSPFQKLTCLSLTANNLRIAVMLANDICYQEENRNEYLSGLEMFVAARTGQELSFIQLGFPQVFLDRQNADLITTGCLTDLSLDFGFKKNSYSPLPNSLLGIHSTISPTIRTLRLLENDRLLLVSHSWIPSEIFKLEKGQRTLEMVSSSLSKNTPDEPFWAGILEP